MKNGKNALIVDFKAPPDWEFRAALEAATAQSWIVEEVLSGQNYGSPLQTLLRYAKYFAKAFRLTAHRREYRRLLAWQQFYGLTTAFFLRLFRAKGAPEITVMTFIYRPKKGPAGVLYRRFIQYAVTSEYVRRLIVFSPGEPQRYAQLFGVPAEKFAFVRLGVEDITQEIPPAPAGDYYLAAGRSNRDYAFLLTAWGPALPLKIVCDELRQKPAANNIELIKRCQKSEYFALLANCRAVIVPLRDETISSGQLSVIQAMMYGKPVIVTANDALTGYVAAGVNGVVIQKNAAALRHALAQVERDYPTLSRNARKSYEKSFRLYTEGLAIGKLL